MSQEIEPTPSRNLTTPLPQHGDNGNDSDNDNERNHNAERIDTSTSSQTEVTSNGTPSSPADDSCEISHGPSSPTTKRKRTSDAWNVIKSTMNGPGFSTEHKGTIRLCLKYGQMLKCTKGKRKATCMTARTSNYAKKCKKEASTTQMMLENQM